VVGKIGYQVWLFLYSCCESWWWYLYRRTWRIKFLFQTFVIWVRNNKVSRVDLPEFLFSFFISNYYTRKYISNCKEFLLLYTQLVNFSFYIHERTIRSYNIRMCDEDFFSWDEDTRRVQHPPPSGYDPGTFQFRSTRNWKVSRIAPGRWKLDLFLVSSKNFTYCWISQRRKISLFFFFLSFFLFFFLPSFLPSFTSNKVIYTSQLKQ